jgi:hypothetical protein
MEPSIEEIQRAAFKHLHLIYIKKYDNGTYKIVDSEKEGIPVLVDYISFHFKTSLLRVKDIGSNIIYLLNGREYRETWVADLLKKDKNLEEKIKEWYPFLWGKGSEEDAQKYKSILRQLKEYVELEIPLKV